MLHINITTVTSVHLSISILPSSKAAVCKYDTLPSSMQWRQIPKTDAQLYQIIGQSAYKM